MVKLGHHEWLSLVFHQLPFPVFNEEKLLFNVLLLVDLCLSFAVDQRVEQ